jgi:multidrug efflux pump subunit AcrA (membrane-fusion protein)
LRLAEAELKSAEEAVELARLEHRERVDALARRTLRSPFDGVVMDQYLHPGALVDGGEGNKPILKLAQTHPLAVQAILPFRLFPQLKVGMPVTVLPEPPFGGEIRATLRTVDRVVDAAAGTVGVVAELDNRNQRLPAGIRCKLRF